jgi:hypothetical protein
MDEIKKFKTINLEFARNEISKNTGIYIWLDSNENIVYIGIACGKDGLHHRICNQHLNPNYLEFRESKHNARDKFQLDNAILKLSNKNITKKGIDKSSFRKSIGRNLNLKPGKETCDYIYKNLKLKVFESNNIKMIKELERELIIKLSPLFNTAYK